MFYVLNFASFQGYNRSINCSFMIAGGAKFTLDRHIVLSKKKHRSLSCSSVFDVAAAINISSTVDRAEIVGLPSDRTVIDMCDPNAYFSNTDQLLLLLLLAWNISRNTWCSTLPIIRIIIQSGMRTMTWEPISQIINESHFISRMEEQAIVILHRILLQ